MHAGDEIAGAKLPGVKPPGANPPRAKFPNAAVFTYGILVNSIYIEILFLILSLKLPKYFSDFRTPSVLEVLTMEHVSQREIV
jgi:hypothetical protein